MTEMEIDTTTEAVKWEALRLRQHHREWATGSATNLLASIAAAKSKGGAK